MTERHTKFS